MDDCLEGRIVGVNQVNNIQKQEMFNLLTKNFDGYNRDNFEKDLSQKTDVILLETSTGKVKGFTTIQHLEVTYEDKPIKGVFSGDTIVDPAYWSKHDMFKKWLRYTLEKKEESDKPLYWFLICSGCRTYKIVPTFFADFHPRFDKEGTTYQKNLLDLFAKQKFGSDYDPNSGLIVFSNSQERLKTDLAQVEENKIRNPHVAYFLKRNPEYYKGHELACIVDISNENLSFIGQRLIK